MAFDLARRWSSESACRKTRRAVLDAVKGSRWGTSPREHAVSLCVEMISQTSVRQTWCSGKWETSKRKASRAGQRQRGRYALRSAPARKAIGVREGTHQASRLYVAFPRERARCTPRGRSGRGISCHPLHLYTPCVGTGMEGGKVNVVQCRMERGDPTVLH